MYDNAFIIDSFSVRLWLWLIAHFKWLSKSHELSVLPHLALHHLFTASARQAYAVDELLQTVRI